MNSIAKTMIISVSAVFSVYSCKIADPDFFVPEVTINQATDPVTFGPEGGNYSFNVEANCDWSILCPADWVVLSATSGNLDGTVTINIPDTKLERNTTVTVYSNEVEAKKASFKIVQYGVVEISSVSRPIALNTETASGSEATLKAGYTGLSISDDDVITAGFVIEADGETAIEKDADVIDRDNSTIEASLTGLTKNKEYTCKAWAQLNDMEKVYSESMTFTPTSIPKAIVSVAVPEVTGARSEDGTTATLSSSYTAVSLEDSDIVTAGFVLVTASGENIPVSAAVDKTTGTFTAFAENLVTGTTYTCTAWARVNDMENVESEGSVEFTPSISRPVTVTADFSSNDIWQLPDNKDAMVQEEKTVIDNDGYTWIIYGGCISNGCLWLACDAKSGYNGYIILPRLEDMTVTSIDFPNDGSGASGSARITIHVSTDNGNSFTQIPGCVGVKPGRYELANQKPGSIYKIENVVDSQGKSGYSKTVRLTINAE